MTIVTPEEIRLGVETKESKSCPGGDSLALPCLITNGTGPSATELFGF